MASFSLRRNPLRLPLSAGHLPITSLSSVAISARSRPSAEHALAAGSRLFAWLPHPAIFGVGVVAGIIAVAAARGWLGLRLPRRRQAALSAQSAPAPAESEASRQGRTRPTEATGTGTAPVATDGLATPETTDLAVVRKLLGELESLRVILADGPSELTERLLDAATAELTGDQAPPGLSELILAGFPALDQAGGIACYDRLSAALDRVAARTVRTRRILDAVSRQDGQDGQGGGPDGDDQGSPADGGLTVVVSRLAPTPRELALLVDLVNEPGRTVALLPTVSLTATAPQPSVIRLGRAATKVALARLSYSTDLPAGLAIDIQPPAPVVHLTRPANAPAPANAAGLANAAGQADAPHLTRPATDPSSSPPPASPASAASTDQVATTASRTQPSPTQPSPTQPSLRIGVLGQLTINGQPGALLPAQTQLIVALALHDETGLPNHQLCELLGADSEHPKPADSLRQLIARTRRQLGLTQDGAEWIEHRGHGRYALHRDSRLDWREFETLTKQGTKASDAGQLASALAMIRGQPFTGCYYWWLDIELVEAVSTRIVTAASTLAALSLADHKPTAAARAARIGLVADSTSEMLWRLLMRAEHSAGNLAGVREAWSRCLDAVADIAADGEPERQTAELYRQLLVR
jgi:DNA-binding SARP family transcriptional activator